MGRGPSHTAERALPLFAGRPAEAWPSAGTPVGEVLSSPPLRSFTDPGSHAANKRPRSRLCFRTSCVASANGWASLGSGPLEMCDRKGDFSLSSSHMEKYKKTSVKLFVLFNSRYQNYGFSM